MKKLTIDDMFVSQELQEAALCAAFVSPAETGSPQEMEDVLKAVLLYLTQHPNVPDIAQEAKLNAELRAYAKDGGVNQVRFIAVAWGGMQFLKSEPSVPAEVKAIAEDYLDQVTSSKLQRDAFTEALMKGFELGRLQGKQEGGSL